MKHESPNPGMEEPGKPAPRVSKKHARKALAADAGMPRWKVEGARRRALAADAIIADVNAGMSVPEAVRKAGVKLATFKLWEKKYATLQRAGKRKTKDCVSPIPPGEEARKRFANAVRDAFLHGRPAGHVLAEFANTAAPRPAPPSRRDMAREKAVIADAVIETANLGVPLLRVLAEMGVPVEAFYRWQKQYATLGRVPSLKKLTTLEETQKKTRVVDGIIASVNGGMPLARALRQANLSRNTFLAWEKQYATLGRVPFQKKRTTPEEAQKKTRVVDGIIASVNGGMPLARALRQANLSRSTFLLWEKQHATLRRQKQHPSFNASGEAERRKNEVNAIIENVNNGMTLNKALAEKKMRIQKFYLWEKQYGTLERKKRLVYPKFPRPTPAELRRRARVVKSILKNHNNGMRLRDAARKAGISPHVFRKWEKRATPQELIQKRHACRVSPKTMRRRERLLAGIARAIHGGMSPTKAVANAGITKNNYYYWKRQFAAKKTPAPPENTAES